MQNSATEHFDASEWPRDFDVRAEFAEQAELLEQSETLEISE